MFTKKQLQKLQDDGKIRGFGCPDIKVHLGGNLKMKPLVNRRSKGLDYIGFMIAWWCKEKCLQLAPEYEFDPHRKWRFDFEIPALKVAVEFEGGVFLQNSGHKTAKHFTKDTDKYNSAAALGWRVIRFTAKNYKSLITELNKFL